MAPQDKLEENAAVIDECFHALGNDLGDGGAEPLRALRALVENKRQVSQQKAEEERRTAAEAGKDQESNTEQTPAAG